MAKGQTWGSVSRRGYRQPSTGDSAMDATLRGEEDKPDTVRKNPPKPPPKPVVHSANMESLPPGVPNTPLNRNRQALINEASKQNRKKQSDRRMREFDRLYGGKR